jgi:hypothetical protein
MESEDVAVTAPIGRTAGAFAVCACAFVAQSARSAAVVVAEVESFMSNPLLLIVE